MENTGEKGSFNATIDVTETAQKGMGCDEISVNVVSTADKKKKESERKKEQKRRKKKVAATDNIDNSIKAFLDMSTKDLQPFEIRETPNKGLGVFATQMVKAGTRLIAEKPLVMIPSEGTDPERLIWTACESLDADRRARFDQLFCHMNTEATVAFIAKRVLAQRLGNGPPLAAEASEAEFKAIKIFQTNVVQMGPKGSHGIGVFGTYSRINHSCVPNVHNSYNTTTGCLTVHATCDIMSGEEILTSYVDSLYRPHAIRAQHISNYGFVCDCQACVGITAKQSEVRRERMFDLDQGLAMYSQGMRLSLMSFHIPRTPKAALRAVTELIKLMKEEGLTGFELSMAYYESSKYNLELGNHSKALDWARKEQEIDIMCKGTDDDAYLIHEASGASMIKKLESIDRKND